MLFAERLLPEFAFSSPVEEPDSQSIQAVYD